jgi:hypothetical protein
MNKRAAVRATLLEHFSAYRAEFTAHGILESTIRLQEFSSVHLVGCMGRTIGIRAITLLNFKNSFNGGRNRNFNRRVFCR